MTSENETVAEIREDVHEYLTSIGPGEYPDETQFEEFADRFVAAHKREMDAVIKDRDEMYRSEQETVAKTKVWFDDYQSTRREVAELRECLEQAYGDKIGTYTMKGDEVERWRKALHENERLAYEREAKDGK